MKTYFACVRVSTSKQSTGVSLTEQRTAIERYAVNRQLPICHWFEQIQTAAKSGRPGFDEMLRHLTKRQDNGVVDRGQEALDESPCSR